MAVTGFDQISFISGVRFITELVSGLVISVGKVVSIILLPLKRIVSMKL